MRNWLRVGRQPSTVVLRLPVMRQVTMEFGGGGSGMLDELRRVRGREMGGVERRWMFETPVFG